MINETLREERSSENGSNGQPLAVTEGIVWSLGRLQRIENEAVSLFETSAKRGLNVGRDLVRAGIVDTAEVGREAVKAVEEIGTSLIESAAALAKIAVSSSGEVGRETVAAVAQSVKLAAAETSEAWNELAAAAEQTFRRSVESGLESTKSVVDFARVILDHTVIAAGDLGQTLLRVVRTLIIGSFDSASDAAAATPSQPRPGPAPFPPPEETRVSSHVLEMA